MVDKKILIAGGVVAVMAATIILSKKSGAVSTPDGSLVLELFDSQGKPVPHKSPWSVTEGATYTARVTVKNTSYKVSPEYPVGARLTVKVVVGSNNYSILSNSMALEYGPGETKTLSWNFTIPIGAAGDSGGIVAASVEDPNGVQLKSVGDAMTIGAAEIIYGADIVFV